MTFSNQNIRRLLQCSERFVHLNLIDHIKPLGFVHAIPYHVFSLPSVFIIIYFFTLSFFVLQHCLLLAVVHFCLEIYVNLRVIRSHKCQLKANIDIYYTQNVSSGFDRRTEWRRRRKKNTGKTNRMWLTYTLRQYIHIASRSLPCNEWRKWTHFRNENDKKEPIQQQQQKTVHCNQKHQERMQKRGKKRIARL